jgi:hypothetical protein
VPFNLKRLSVLALVAAVSPLMLPDDWVATARASSRPCKAYLDTRSKNIDVEINNCPVAVGTFLIRGTFANPSLQMSFGAWEAGYYILYVKNRKDNKIINMTGFDVNGTTSRPQYRFKDGDVTYVVSFRYSDANTIRLEAYRQGQIILNELLRRESDKLLGGP